MPSRRFKMIIEPEFPEDFVALITTIVDREIDIDLAKARIRVEQAETLFQSIDHLHCGEIFVEDLYVYLKRNNLVLTKKDLKFINRYFGFSSHEKLDLELFREKFLTHKSPSFDPTDKQPNSEEAFLEMIKKALSSYNQIQDLRTTIAANISQLQACFRAFYSDNPYFLTKPMLLEILSCLKMYSRLNYNLLCNYMIGEEAKEVSLKQVFWKEQSNNYLQPNNQFTALDKQTSGAKPRTHSGDMDILLQIENIENVYAFKNHQLADRSKITEPLDKVGNKLAERAQRLSEANRSSLVKKRQQENEHFQTQQHRSNIRLSSSKDKKYASKDVDEILKRSIHEYSDEFEENEKQIERLYRNRKLSRSREEVLSRASSSVKLRIQEIEKKVMLQAHSNTQHEALRTPMKISLNQELRSKFSSLKKK